MQSILNSPLLFNSTFGWLLVVFAVLLFAITYYFLSVIVRKMGYSRWWLVGVFGATVVFPNALFSVILLWIWAFVPLRRAPLKSEQPKQPGATGAKAQALAIAEFDGSARRKDLWTQLFDANGGDENVAKQLYLTIRAGQIQAALDLIQNRAGDDELSKASSRATAQLGANRLNPA
jgi:hypothetical protein